MTADDEADIGSLVATISAARTAAALRRARNVHGNVSLATGQRTERTDRGPQGDSSSGPSAADAARQWMQGELDAVAMTASQSEGVLLGMRADGGSGNAASARANEGEDSMPRRD